MDIHEKPHSHEYQTGNIIMRYFSGMTFPSRPLSLEDGEDVGTCSPASVDVKIDNKKDESRRKPGNLMKFVRLRIGILLFLF